MNDNKRPQACDANIKKMDLKDDRTGCPCKYFSTSAQVISALSSAEKTEILIRWIEGASTKVNGDSVEKLEVSESQACFNNVSGKPSKCIHRVGAAYCILNAIRDGCRVFLESQCGQKDRVEMEQNSHNKASGDFAEYEDSFPSLSSMSSSRAQTPNILKAKKKKKIKPMHVSYNNITPEKQYDKSTATNHTGSIKAKRRIRPAPVPLAQQSPWGNIAAVKSDFPDSNTRNSVNGREPADYKDPMVRAMEGTGVGGVKAKRRIKPVPVSPAQPRSWGNIAATASDFPDLSSRHQSNSISSKDSIARAVEGGNLDTTKIKRRIRPAPDPSTQQSPWGNIAATKSENIDLISKNSIDQKKSTTSKDPMSRAMGSTYNASPDLEKGRNLKKNYQNEFTRIRSTRNDEQGSRKTGEENAIVPGNSIASKIISTSVNLSLSESSSNVRRKDSNIQEYKSNHVLDQAMIVPEDKKIHLENIANVYCAIIKSQLSPSAALELQLILRLVALSDKGVGAYCTEEKDLHLLKPVFKSPHICRHFALRVLKKLSHLLVNFDSEILLHLLRLEIFVQELPDLAKDVQVTVEQHRDILLSEGNHGQDDVVVSGKSTILNRPFQDKRDSRHNYRSRNLTSIYNNREQCRDVFLFQLRAFQQMKGTVLNPTQIHKSLDTIKQALCQMMVELLPSNKPWFAELFTDLLLQIGLVPMQELDADILKNVADKDRLQKLHSRFTSKVAQKNRSSKPLVLGDGASLSTPSPEHFFTDNQEFFLLFIQSVDSYSFNVHLKKRLVDLILTMSSSDETRGLEQRISELMLLSKFLGLLVFSPNWNLGPTEPAENSPHLHFTPAIPINTIIKEGFVEGKLILVIPLALSFLWMMNWDKMSKQLPYYRETFGMLRCIHKELSSQIFEGYTPHAHNLLLIGLRLDSFFADVVGLSEAEHFSDYKLANISSNSIKKSLDMVPYKFSRKFLLSSSSHLDDLFKLTAELARNGRIHISTGTTKKLKPYSLSSNPSSSFIDSIFTPKEHFEALDPIEQGKLQGFLSQNPTSVQGHGPGKLIDAFFHQHRHLQLLCDFVVDYSIEHVLTKRCLDECIKPNVQNLTFERVLECPVPSPLGLDWYLQSLQHIEKEATLTVHHYTRQTLKEYIIAAMKSLIPSYVDIAVKQMATTLTIDHALRKGDAITISLVRTEAKKAIDSHLNPKTSKAKDSVGEHLIIFNDELINEIQGLVTINVDTSSSPDQFYLTENHVAKIENISSKLFAYADRGNTFNTTSIDAAESLVQTLGNILTAWVSRSKMTSDMPYPTGLNELLNIVFMIGHLGFSFKSLLSFGRLLCDPSTLKMIIRCRGSLDIKRFQDNCMRGKLMKSADLINGLFELLENHSLSQDAAIFSIELVKQLR